MPRQTPSQTIGPFFAHAMTPRGGPFRASAGERIDRGRSAGARIRIEGTVRDGAGKPVPDAMIELWQVGPDGRPSFRGFGRSATDVDGRYGFETVKPSSCGPGFAPHVSLIVFARGMLNHAFTRLYFADEAAANQGDELLTRLPPERRRTLLATPRADSDRPTYEFDIRLQGDEETVFLDA